MKARTVAEQANDSAAKHEERTGGAGHSAPDDAPESDAETRCSQREETHRLCPENCWLEEALEADIEVGLPRP